MSLVRTLQFIGSAYGDTDVNLTATFNDIVVFDGNVVTKPVAEKSLLFPDQYVLFTVEVPMFHYGNIPTSITVNSGTVVTVASVFANYCAVIDPPNNTTTSGATGFRPSFTGIPIIPPEEPIDRVDSKINVKIDGVLAPHLPEPPGEWSYDVGLNSTMTFDTVLLQGYAGDNS